MTQSVPWLFTCSRNIIVKTINWTNNLHYDVDAFDNYAYIANVDDFDAVVYVDYFTAVTYVVRSEKLLT